MGTSHRPRDMAVPAVRKAAEGLEVLLRVLVEQGLFPKAVQRLLRLPCLDAVR